MRKRNVIGIGPGAAEQMAVRVRVALAAADVFMGYGACVDLVK